MENDQKVFEIQKNLDRVVDRLEKAAINSGRKMEDLRLVAVTKGQPLEIVRSSIRAGITELGENYPEEALLKINELTDLQGIHWHMIGHLQSRKVRIIAEHFDVLQSLDSVHLAEKLNRNLAEKDKVLPVLLEINIGEEESKTGWRLGKPNSWDLIIPEIEQIHQMPNLSIEGLMAMPPIAEDPENSRPYFKQMVKLQQFLQKQCPWVTWKQLSMGTSSDYWVAVEEGATIVRIGQAIVGKRPPKI